MIKIVRTATVPVSLNILLKGQLKRLSETYNVIAVSSQGEELRQVEVREGVETYSIPFVRNISPLKDLISLYLLIRLLRQIKPEIIHSITPKAGLISMIAGRITGVPIRIHVFTGLIFPYRKGFTKKLLIFMDRILCACATHIFPEGSGVKKDLIRYNITNKPLNIIANGNINGVDTSFFNRKIIDRKLLSDLREELQLTKADFIFTFVGRLSKEKGVLELIRAFREIQLDLKERGITTKLLLIGGYDDKTFKNILEREISSQESIIKLGFQEDIRPFLCLSSVLILPSYREGFPNVLLQAGAMGLPSIATDVSGSNEIINNLNGIIVPAKSCVSLKKAMLEIIENFHKFDSQLIRQEIINKYDTEIVWCEIERIYKNLLEKLEQKEL